MGVSCNWFVFFGGLFLLLIISHSSVGEEEATTLDIRSVKDLLDNSDYYYLDVRYTCFCSTFILIFRFLKNHVKLLFTNFCLLAVEFKILGRWKNTRKVTWM